MVLEQVFNLMCFKGDVKDDEEIPFGARNFFHVDSVVSKLKKLLRRWEWSYYTRSSHYELLIIM